MKTSCHCLCPHRRPFICVVCEDKDNGIRSKNTSENEKTYAVVCVLTDDYSIVSSVRTQTTAVDYLAYKFISKPNLFHNETIIIFVHSYTKLTINKQFKVMMLEAEKKVYEQVLNNQQSNLGQSEIDELLDLLLEINKQLAELKNEPSK